VSDAYLGYHRISCCISTVEPQLQLSKGNTAVSAVWINSKH
jgi:hypothetical protein